MELLVVIAIMGIILSLLLSAVLQSLATAHRTACMNNLRQISLALSSFESQHRHFPRAFCGRVDLPPDFYTLWCVSPAVQLTPFLGDQPTWNQLSGKQTSTSWDLSRERTMSPAVLRCPADGLARDSASSYRFCRGLLPLWPGDPGGAFVGFRKLGTGDITDGLANTAFVSERLIGTPAGTDRRRDLIELPHGTVASSVTPLCLQANARGGPFSAASLLSPLGSVWTSGDWAQCAYYHFFPPNYPWRDCGPGGMPGIALVSARSVHTGGAHVLFGDGHGQFIAQTIDLSVWRSWSTRAERDF